MTYATDELQRLVGNLREQARYYADPDGDPPSKASIARAEDFERKADELERLANQLAAGAPVGGSRFRIEQGNGWTMVLGEAFAWLLDQDDDAVDALIVDPPYSSGGFVRGDRMSAPSKKYVQNGSEPSGPDFDGDNRDQRGYLAWSTLWLTEALRVVRPGAPCCIWTDWRQLPVTTDAMQAGGFVWRGIAAWTKEGASRPQMGRFRADTEFVVWGSRGAMPPRTDVGVLPGSWQCAPVHAAAREHVTEKPVEVMEGVVVIAPPGGLVLDLFAGSGSTGVACLRRGRRFVGVERSEEYFTRAVERLRAEEAMSTVGALRCGQEALFKAG